jgi:rare lipoprotein A
MKRYLPPFLLLGLLLAGAPRGGCAEEGLASWYGGKFQGRRTASGEIFDTRQLTAAHRTLPFGTRVRVTHLETKRSVVVRINDRGPFVEGRIVDLSQAAATAIGMGGAGVARVSLEVVEGPPGGPAWWIQLGSFRDRENALRLQAQAEARGFHPVLEAGPDGVIRVVLRGIEEKDLEGLTRRLSGEGFERVLVRADRGSPGPMASTPPPSSAGTPDSP